jgi:hypothetical protein
MKFVSAAIAIAVLTATSAVDLCGKAYTKALVVGV